MNSTSPILFFSRFSSLVFLEPCDVFVFYDDVLSDGTCLPDDPQPDPTYGK